MTNKIIKVKADQIPSILRGDKVQTRRLLENQPHQRWNHLGEGKFCSGDHQRCNPCETTVEFKPKYQPGDICELHEVSREECLECGGVGKTHEYIGEGSFSPDKTDCPVEDCEDGQITTTKDTGKRIEIIGVRCERLWFTTHQDMVAEGIEDDIQTAKAKFIKQIESIYPGSWERNDWVFAYEFGLVTA